MDRNRYLLKLIRNINHTIMPSSSPWCNLPWLWVCVTLIKREGGHQKTKPGGATLNFSQWPPVTLPHTRSSSLLSPYGKFQILRRTPNPCASVFSFSSSSSFTLPLLLSSQQIVERTAILCSAYKRAAEMPCGEGQTVPQECLRPSFKIHQSLPV